MNFITTEDAKKIWSWHPKGIYLLVTTQERRNQIDFLFHRSRGGTHIAIVVVAIASNYNPWIPPAEAGRG